MDEPAIAALREQIDLIDGALRDLIDARLGLAGAVGRCKAGAPVRQPDREAEVRAAWEAHARTAGWPEGLAGSLAEALLSAGREVQRPG